MKQECLTTDRTENLVVLEMNLKKQCSGCGSVFKTKSTVAASGT